MAHNPFPIPKKYLSSSAQAALGRVKSEALRKYVANWDGASGVAILGDTGTGKSLCAAVACERVRSKAGTDGFVKWIRADELTRLLQERSGSDLIGLVKVARVLVIDEVGYERWPETLLEVIGSRYDHERPTVLTTGLKEDAFALRYSDATIRRISETGNGIVVNCWGKS
jgi:DNA replication protein DnaC